MNRKIVSLLLICLVTLSIVYSCSGTALPSQQPQPDDVVSSGTCRTSERLNLGPKPSFREPRPKISGDPVDDPRPRR